MRVSRRAETLIGEGGDGWDVYRRAHAMKAAGEPVIQLNIGDHDITTDPAILDAMDASARGGNLGYAPIPGSDALRSAIAERVERMTGVPTRAANVVVTSGGQGALFATHAVACDPGDAALYIEPAYATYPGTLRAVSAVPRPIPALSEDGFQPRGAATRAAAEGARSLLVNSPHNPTGVVYTRETMEDIAAACRDCDLWLISDEVYDSQVWDGAHVSPRALPGMAGRTMVIGSMSKSHAMTGSRIGWVIAPEDVAAHIIDLSTHTTYGLPGFIQDAALYALRQGPELEARVAAPFRRRRDLALRILQGSNTLRVIPSGGGMYVMLDIRATGMTGEGFANALLDAERIGVMPGESFGAAGAGHIRVALTVDDNRLAEALERLRRFAEGEADAA